jgi:hypothetical protein
MIKITIAASSTLAILGCVLLPIPTARGDDVVVLRGKVAEASFAVGGGALFEFQFVDQQANPLAWDSGGTDKTRARGHFLCLDRWGPPSAAEGRNGIPFHGEAPRAIWQVSQAPRRSEGQVVAQMDCTLPMAGLTVERTVSLAVDSPLLTVTEQITNTNLRGRIYNMVQHPTIGPPFLDDSTLVDSNAGHGFWQDGPIPESFETASDWPTVEMHEQVNLRRFRNKETQTPQSDVSSFVFADGETYGWVTACNADQELLIGYLWRTADYPWLNMWRSLREGKVAARGLEFGTTGYHQPFPQLVEAGRILDRPLFHYIDASQTVGRSYAVFLAKIPIDYRGVERITYAQEQLTLSERGPQNSREIKLATGRLF